jgi:hypothetical protein
LNLYNTMGQSVNTLDSQSVKPFLPNGQWDNIWPIVESYASVAIMELPGLSVHMSYGYVSDVDVFDDTHIATLMEREQLCLWEFVGGKWRMVYSSFVGIIHRPVIFEGKWYYSRWPAGALTQMYPFDGIGMPLHKFSIKYGEFDWLDTTAYTVDGLERCAGPLSIHVSDARRGSTPPDVINGLLYFDDSEIPASDVKIGGRCICQWGSCAPPPSTPLSICRRNQKRHFRT